MAYVYKQNEAKNVYNPWHMTSKTANKACGIYALYFLLKYLGHLFQCN